MNKNEVNLSEIFLSIQGEGPNIGQPTIFVRFFGCNMKPVCTWCDSMYAVQKPNDNKHIYSMTLPVESIVNTILQYRICKDVTFTGGEPLLYVDQIKQIIDLIALKDEDFKFHIETNGMLHPEFLYNYLDTCVISPKLHAMNLDTTYNECKDPYVCMMRSWVTLERTPIYFKFVYEGKDTLTQINKLKELVMGMDNFPIYLMPEGKEVDILKYQECAQACIDNNYIMAPRLHVIIWGNKRGI